MNPKKARVARSGLSFPLIQDKRVGELYARIGTTSLKKLTTGMTYSMEIMGEDVSWQLFELEIVKLGL